ncbi:MAG TPA: hypothetical protein VGB07_30120 [Blastocatellia bacterium]
MNNKVDLETRIHFRNWLRSELRRLDFYQRRGNHYLIREFAKYCVEHNAPIDEASLGRYLRDDEPVLPTPERCRALARVLEHPPVRVLIEAGYLEGDDLFTALPGDATPAQLTKELLYRKGQVLQAVGSVAVDSPLVIVVEQMKQSAGLMVGQMATRQDAHAFRKELEKVLSSKSSGKGPAATAAEALEEFNEAQKQAPVSEPVPTPTKATKAGATSRKRAAETANR